MTKRDNYQIQLNQAKQRFLTYDQAHIIEKCRLRYDEQYLYMTLLSQPYRLNRKTVNIQRLEDGTWIDGNSFAEVMTLLDWLCDCRTDRFTTGRFANIVTQGANFHRNLQETEKDPDAERFSANPERFCAACNALGGQPVTGADIAYQIEVLDGVQILVKLWHPDEDFPAKLVYLWEENVLRYIRYETTWYALGLFLRRLRENIKETP